MINLLPPKRLLDIRTAYSNTVLRRYIELTLLGLVLVSVMVFGSYYFLDRQQGNTQKILDLNQQKITQLQPIQKQAEELSGAINTIAGLQSQDIKFSELLTKIGNVMPPGAVLTGLQFSIEDLEAPLVISAQVETQEKAAVLRNNLINSELFSKADIQTISSNDTNSSAPGVPSNSQNPGSTNSRYKFTTVINSYLEKQAANGSAKP